MTVRVIKSGLQTSLQDQGRPGHRHLGVPRSGAADLLSLGLANYCAGNSPERAALECTLLGPDLEFLTDCTVAICGAQTDARWGERRLAMNTAHKIKSGAVLSIGAITKGARSYVAISGGVRGRPFLGSVSTYSYASLGGLNGQMLQDGDYLKLGGAYGAGASLPFGFAPQYGHSIALRVMPGPEFDSLTAASRKRVFMKAFTASAQTDRMGAQLTGPKLSLKNKLQLISAPLRIGTVQLPPSGAPIVMLADGHCTGGYVRALQVIRADQTILGQIAPGSKVHFILTDVEGAMTALASKRALYKGLVETL